MTKAYSLDLRRRVVRFVDCGHSRHEAAAHFDVSVAFVVKLVAAWHANEKWIRGRVLLNPHGGFYSPDSFVDVGAGPAATGSLQQHACP